MTTSLIVLVTLIGPAPTQLESEQIHRSGPSITNLAAFEIDLRQIESRPTSDPERPARRVTDTKFWLTAAALNAAMIADTKSTFDVMRRCGVCYEDNPYAAPFIARGPAVAFAAGEAFDVSVLVLAGKMKGSDNKLFRRTWWVVPMALTTGHAIAYRHNLGVAR